MATVTIAASGGDYTTIDDWINSLSSPLSGDEIAEIDGWLGDLGPQTIDVETSSTARIIIRAKAGSETDYTTGETKAGFAYTGVGTGFGAIQVGGNAAHVLIQKIAIEVEPSDHFIRRSASGTYNSDPLIRIEDCFVYALPYGDASDSWFFIDGFSEHTPIEFHNCLGVGVRGSNANTSNILFENCTIVRTITDADNSNVGIRYAVAVRSAVFHFGPTSGFRDYLNLDGSSTENASHDTTGSSGLQSLVLTDQYTDPANQDWSFKVGNSLEGAGTGGVDIGFTYPSAAPPILTFIPRVIGPF